MKLYATVSSERATKGQGGNEYLKISLTVGSAKNAIDFGTLILDQREDEDGNKEAFVLTYNGDEIASYNPNEEKGEKQKGDEYKEHDPYCAIRNGGEHNCKL